MFSPYLRVFSLLLIIGALMLCAGCGGEDAALLPGGDAASSSDGVAIQPQKICDPGKFFCSGKTAYICNAGGTAYEEQTCPAGCLGGTCNSCTPNEKNCDSPTTLKTCKNDGSGYDVQVCTGKCENNQCVDLPEPPDPEEKVCAVGDVSCLDSGTLATCRADEKSYDYSVCDFGCDEENDKCMDPTCEKGALRCNEEEGKEKEVLKCNEAQSGWEISTECTQVCEGGECKTPDGCTPDALFCDGNDIKKCTADGSATEVVDTCPMGCNEVTEEKPACNVCEEASVKCLNEGAVGLCDQPAVGYTEIQQCASGEMCASGKCVAGLAWAEGSTVHEALLLFTRQSVKCWLDGIAKGETTPCMAIDTTNLPKPFAVSTNEEGVEKFKDWWCENDFSAADFEMEGYDSENLYNAANDLHGSCGWWPSTNTNNFDFKVDKGIIQVGQPLGVYCMEFNDEWIDEIFVVNCED